MSKKSFSILTILFLPILCFGQEIITGLSNNKEAEIYYNKVSVSKKGLTSDTLELPFIDDFSNTYVAPDPLKWKNNSAFINNRYSSNPITAGMATLDSYDYNGAPYTNASKNGYIADYLSSQPIDLEYTTDNNIYISFFYQAKGLGDQPEVSDSLCLEFYDVEAKTWFRKWSVPGKEMDEFEYVLLAINEEIFLKKGFQFRFLNYASLLANTDYSDKFSNADHWHLDYIKIDKNRSENDTVFRDVSFVSPLSSILKDYESMPWSHLPSAFIEQRNPYISTEIINLDTSDRNISKYIEINDLLHSNSFKSTPTANDIPSGNMSKYNFDYDYAFNFGVEDSAIIEIKTILQTDAFDYKVNDTLSRQQVFKNYYAYDDGSAELGYGINGQGSKNASAAVHYKAFLGDSLRAVDVYFNQIVDSLNLDYYFYLNVWDDNNGIPGSLIYNQIGVKPVYSSRLNKFVRYYLDTPEYIEGDFFIGWTNTVEKIINIGLDASRNNSSNNYYNLGSEWKSSEAPGSLMIRPVFSQNPLTSTISQPKDERKDNLVISPNPASEFINFRTSGFGSDILKIYIYDLTGKIISQKIITNNESVPVSNIKNGIYLVRIQNMQNGDSKTKKIIIRH